MKTFKLVLSLFMGVAVQQADAQVSQNIILEHFTNTRCGICSSRNPGLFTNLANNPSVLQISYHPSRPYSSCVLYQYNPSGNDGRTNYYGILGGTPRIVINGQVQSSGTSFSSSTIFDNFKNNTTAFEVSVNQELNTTQDSIRIRAIVKTVSSSTLTALRLTIPIVEDSLQYNAPNGESLHHNVFRTMAYDANINAPSLNDSIVVEAMVKIDATWKLTQIKGIGILQNDQSKAIVQVNESEKSLSKSVSNINRLNHIPNVLVYPNPAGDKLGIQNYSGEVRFYNLQGQLVQTASIKENQMVNVNNLPSGLYFVQLIGIDANLKFTKL